MYSSAYRSLKKERLLASGSRLWEHSLESQELALEQERVRVREEAERVHRQRESEELERAALLASTLAALGSASFCQEVKSSDVGDDKPEEELMDELPSRPTTGSAEAKTDEVSARVKAVKINPLLNKLSKQAAASADDTSSPEHSGQEGSGKAAVGSSSKQDAAKSIFKSKIRSKLKGLNKYVLSHSSRKIMVAWNTIEARFQKSPISKTELLRDANGIMHPVKIQAVPLSVLTMLLCSTKVRVQHSELKAIYSKFACLGPDILHARRIAAIRLLLGPTNGKGLKQAPALLEELQVLLLERDEKLVSLDQLREATFPSDPLQRAQEEKSLEAEKRQMMELLMEERKKREEAVQIAEQRKRKTCEDFANTLAEMQYVRQPFGPKQHASLSAVVDFAVREVTAFHAEKDVSVDPEIVELLGSEAFPADYRQTGQQEQRHGDGADKKLRMVALLEDEQQRMRSLSPYGEFRIRLQGHGPVGNSASQTVLELLRETVSFSKGLNGSAYRDVVEWLQAYSSIRMQSAWRAHARRWRYFHARRLWRVIFSRSKTAHFLAWAKTTRHNVDTRDYCWRPLRAWRFYLRRVQRRREIFRVAHWPFYVWRRSAHSSLSSREKSRFLVGRVLPSLLQLRVFGAWKRFSQREARIKRLQDGKVREVERERQRVHFLWLWRWSFRRKRLRRGWLKGGKLMLLRITHERLGLPFQIWRTYVHYKLLVRRRSHRLAAAFKQLMLPAAPPFLPRSRPARRRAYEQERQELQREEAEVAGLEAQAAEQAPMDDVLTEAEAADALDGAAPAPDPGAAQRRRELDARRKALKQQAKRRKNAVLYSPLGAFRWEKRPGCYDYDADSGGEDSLDMPERWFSSYRSVFLEPLEEAAELPFLWAADALVAAKCAALYRAFLYTENWSMLEASFRFHFRAKHCLRNLFQYAKVSKRARQTMRDLEKKRMRVAFDGFLRWMLRDGSGAGTSEADNLKFQVRKTRFDKMVRRRATAAALKLHFEREDELARRALQDKERVGMGGVLAGQDEDVPLASGAAGDAAEDADADASLTIDFLSQDRADREQEIGLMERICRFSSDTRRRIQLIIEQHDDTAQQLVEATTIREATLSNVLLGEEEDTMDAVQQEMQYVARFKIEAADVLVTVLARVHLEVLLVLLRQDLKKYFRALRIPMLEASSLSMCRVKKMRNWIRICRRLIAINRSAAYYNRRRQQWVLFNRWLKLLEIEQLNTTPGLVNQARARLRRYCSFSSIMKRKGYRKTVYLDSKKLAKDSSCTAAVFARWSALTQEEAAMRLALSLAARKAALVILQKCFYALRYGLLTADSAGVRRLNAPFALVRTTCDLQQAGKAFFARRKRCLAYVLKRFYHKWCFLLRSIGRGSLSFKAFAVGYRQEIETRLVIEQREITDAFLMRGTQRVRDLLAPLQGDRRLPSLMGKTEGALFLDPAPCSLGDDPDIPEGFKIYKLRVVAHEQLGVQGWQVVWGADSVAREIEGPKRGKWSGGYPPKEILVPKDDFVVGLEYLYEGNCMYGLRLRLHAGGWTRMAGKRKGLSTLSCYLGCELAPEHDGDTKYVPAGEDERADPGLPRAFVIGFWGLNTPQRATCMGLVVRQVVTQSIFSYTWVHDALAAKEAKNSVLAVQDGGAGSIAQDSLPSQVYPLGGGPVDDESLSMGSAGNALPVFAQQPSPQASSPGDISPQGSPKEMLADTFHKGQAVVIRDHDDNDSIPGRASPERRREPLSSSEMQFFDVIRMRTTEIKVAEARALEFAKRLFSSPKIRADPQLFKLSSVRILGGLSRWLFQSTSRRLLQKSPTEGEGTKLVQQSMVCVAQADSLSRRIVQMKAEIEVLERATLEWRGRTMLGPAERKEKSAQAEKQRLSRQLLLEAEVEIKELEARAVELDRRGRNLLPRLQLSTFVVANYRIKVAASRHKENLLERMSLDDIKAALAGGGTEGEGILSAQDMDLLRGSLGEGKSLDKYHYSVEDFISKERLAQSRSQQLLEAEATAPGAQRPFRRRVFAINAAHAAHTARKNYVNYLSQPAAAAPRKKTVVTALARQEEAEDTADKAAPTDLMDLELE